MRRYTIITMGCKVNRYESDGLAEQLETLGWRPADTQRDPDLVVINTCTVTGKASMQARQAIRKAIREYPAARIVTTGCYAQASPAEIAEITGVHDIVGQADKHRIPRLLDTYAPGDGGFPSPTKRDMDRVRSFESGDPPVFGSRTRPFLKIQDGCDAFCTYCIVPYTRGRSRSMPPGDVMAHLTALGKGSRLEAVLTGIHLGCYGKDLDPPSDLLALMNRIERVQPLPRVRLSSIEPQELTREIIDCVAASKVFCHHFHIPLQSGDDEILARMKRPYTVEQIKILIRSITRKIPDAAIGLDVLVGFPGENSNAFEKTKDVIQSLPVAYLHVFPFSARPGTPAARFADQVQPDVCKERAKEIRKIGMEKKNRFYEKFLGRPLEILVEDKREPTSGGLKGFSSNYIPVLLDGEDRLKNRLVTVEPFRLEKGVGLMGKIR